jgi:SRF-type transcription factor (DNA-binding and dimerisation domain)
MATNKSKRRSENLGRRKKTLLKKVHELGKYYNVDVALIIRQNSQYITYRSIDLES